MKLCGRFFDRYMDVFTRDDHAYSRLILWLHNFFVNASPLKQGNDGDNILLFHRNAGERSRFTWLFTMNVHTKKPHSRDNFSYATNSSM